MSTTILFTSSLILTAATAFHLLLHKRDPTSTLSWLLFLVIMPFLGPLIYFGFGSNRIRRKAHKRTKQIDIKARHGRSSLSRHRRSTLSRTEARGSELFRLARTISRFEPTTGNSVDLLANPQQTLDAMKEAISSASIRVHLEYYIVANDEVTEELFERLAEAAQRGVEVRLLYDSLGSVFIRKLLLRKLTKAGVKVAAFLPFSLWNLWQRINPHFRNHRKILVVDGKLAFTGGVNIGREYLGRGRHDQWRDFAVRLTGPCCAQLDEVFCGDWEFTTKQSIEVLAPCDSQTNQVSRTSDLIQVVESGPDTVFHTLHQIIFFAISTARQNISMTTPYFVPDASIALALATAAIRGVQVELVLPAKTDLPLVRLAGRSFYEHLLKAGVVIYEYQPTVLHSKLILIDRSLAIVGSANMDIRSFRLNFELNLLVNSSDFALQTRTMFEADMSASQKVNPAAFLQRGWRDHIAENTAAIFSPWL